MNTTTRCHPRSLRYAFKEFPENCLGIEGNVIQVSRPWWVRLLRVIFNFKD